MLLLPTAATAATLRYTLVPVGGATWEYAYTLTHDGIPAGAPLEQFAIGFDPARYREASLTVLTPAPLSTQWDEQVLASGPALDAFYDVQALAGGLAEGESASGFRVRFEWLGTGTPGGQPFWVFAPGNPVPLQQGTTHADPRPIPAMPAGGLALLAAGLAALGTRRLSRRPRP